MEAEEQYLFAKSVEAKEHFDYYVFGHRHLIINEPIASNSRLIVLGDWIRKFSFGVFDGNEFKIEKIEDNKLKEYRITS
jgi:UDP-2,3-diacylglucosamine hydrolase